MNKFLACFFAGILCSIFVACGDEVSSSNGNYLPDKVADKNELFYYKCDEDVIGSKVYVVDVRQYYECDGEWWFKSNDKKRSSSSSAKSSSSSKKYSSSGSKETDSEDSSSSSAGRSSSSSRIKATGVCASEMDFDESEEWIDGKTVFPVGTFDCSTYDCLSTDPLNPDMTYGEMLDERDNQVYKVIRIGKHVWFAQNLNFETDSSSESTEYRGRSYSWCDMMDLPSDNCGEGIYSNISDINHQGRCPKGWHVPNKKETIGLFCAIGSSSLNYKISSKVSTDFTSDSTNMSGLSVVYGGRWVEFATSTEYDEKAPWGWTWCSGWDDYADVFPDPEDRVSTGRWKESFQTVRCVRDEKNDETVNLLPTCDDNREGFVTSKDSMYLICKQGAYRRATNWEMDTFGKVCSDANIGEIIEGNVNDSIKYCCTVEGWENMKPWSWNVPKESRLNPYETYGDIEDKRDGQIYKTVKIDNKVWMAQNLNYADSVNTPNLKGNSWCYENDDAHCDVVGRLYTWEAAVDALADSTDVLKCKGDSTCLLSAKVRGICPEGFRLPSYDDWNSFKSYSPAYKTKTGWNSYYVAGMGGSYNSGNGSDGLGLSMLPAGVWKETDRIYVFSGAGTYTSFWASTEVDSSRAWAFSLSNSSGFVDLGKYISDFDKMNGRSIRCVKDEE